MIEKSTVIAKDTTTISRVAAKDSTTLKTKIDSIIIEEYAVDQSELTTNGHNDHSHKLRSYKKRNDISQNKVTTPSKKIKIYGVNLSSTRLENKDSLYKQTAHQEKTINQVKQKSPTKSTAGGKIIFVLIAITLLLFAGYVIWKNAVQ